MANFVGCDFLHFPPLPAGWFSRMKQMKNRRVRRVWSVKWCHHTEYPLKDDLLGLQTGTTSSFARWRSPAFLMLTVLTVLRFWPTLALAETNISWFSKAGCEWHQNFENTNILAPFQSRSVIKFSLAFHGMRKSVCSSRFPTPADLAQKSRLR